MPRLVGVQLQACDPTARAFHEGRDAVTPVDKKPSLSDAIMNNNPYWGRYCLQAVRETGGTMISVSDADFIRTIRELGREWKACSRNRRVPSPWQPCGTL